MTKAKTTTKRSAQKSEPVKINLGAGEHWLEGWDNVDLVMPTIEMLSGGRHVDLSVFPWPFDENSADEMMASHILEHFDKLNGKCFLAECARILKPGGKLHVAVPDMDIFIDCRNNVNWLPVHGYYWTDFNHFFGGNETEKRPEMRHYYMYNVETLTAMMLAAGFSTAEKRDPLPEDNSRYHAISLYVTGVK